MGPETRARTRFAHTRFSFVAETAISGCDAGTNPDYAALMGPETGQGRVGQGFSLDILRGKNMWILLVCRGE